jgi:hypothetical protein
MAACSCSRWLRLDISDLLRTRLIVSKAVDLSASEAEGRFLEGTGSVVLDRGNRIAYAALSPQTNETALLGFCARAGYRAVSFNERDYSESPFIMRTFSSQLGRAQFCAWTRSGKGRERR